jgi:hypothetical protein
MADDLHDADALFGREPRELARRTVRIEAMHTLGDQPVDVTSQFTLMNLALGIERNDVGSEDAFELGLRRHGETR